MLLEPHKTSKQQLDCAAAQPCTSWQTTWGDPVVASIVGMWSSNRGTSTPTQLQDVAVICNAPRASWGQLAQQPSPSAARPLECFRARTRPVGIWKSLTLASSVGGEIARPTMFSTRAILIGVALFRPMGGDGANTTSRTTCGSSSPRGLSPRRHEIHGTIVQEVPQRSISIIEFEYAA